MKSGIRRITVNAFIGYCLSILYYNFCLFLYYNYIIGYALCKRVDLLPYPMLQISHMSLQVTWRVMCLLRAVIGLTL